MKKLIAIGGGEIGRPGYPVETTKIDKEIINLTNKQNPKLLFIPTASSDAEPYFDTIKKHFGKRLNCKVDVLYLLKEKPTLKQIKTKILTSDIIYVGGGNTALMLKTWKKTGVDKILLKAYSKGIVISGLSAGSICWFRYGISDSRKFNNPKAGLCRISGLNIIDALHCPHYNVEQDRKPQLKAMMKKEKGVALALDNCCALEVIDKTYRIISSKATANAYKVYWKDNKFFEEVIQKTKNFQPINKLLKK